MGSVLSVQCTGLLTSICRADGKVERFIYDENSPDPLAQGNVLRVELSSSPLPYSATRTLRKFTYDPRYRQLRTLEDEGGRITRFFYDFDRDPTSTALNLEKIQYPDTTLSDGSRQTDCIHVFVYDSRGQLIEMRSPEGRRTTIDYQLAGNGAGLAKSVTQHDPDAPLVKRFEYDALGNLAKVIDADGNVVVTSYNLLGQLTSTTMPPVNGSTAVFKLEYNADRLPARQFIPRGDYADPVLQGGWIINELTYDPASQLSRVVHFANTAASSSESWVRDVFGDIVCETDAIGRVTRYRYDERGLVLERVEYAQTAAPRITRYRYDLGGRITRIVEPDQTEKRFAYDSFGRLKTIVDPIGNAAVYSYGADDHITRIDYYEGADLTAPPFKTFEYDYDERNRLRACTINGLRETYLYDRDDLAIGRRNQTGAVSMAAYDGLARPVKIVDPVGNVHWTEYDLRGNVRRTRNEFISSDHSRASWLKEVTYDALNRPLRP